MAGLFPEITIVATLVDGTEQKAVIRASAMIKTEREYGKAISDLGGKIEPLLFMTHTQLKHDGLVLPVFDSWLLKVTNIEVIDQDAPVLSDVL